VPKPETMRVQEAEFLAPDRAEFPAFGDTDISVVDLVRVLSRRGRFLALSTVCATAAATAIVFLIPPQYKAEAVIMPPQQPQSTLSALTTGALGVIAGGGVATQLGLKGQTDLYIGVLRSRTIADSLISQFKLQAVYKEPTLSDTRRALDRHATIEPGKDTMIHISVEDRDPVRATAIANAYVDQLYQQNSRLALTEASQRRLFFQQQLAAEKTALAEAEVSLRKNQESSGLVLPAGQGEALIQSTARLRAELASREVELQAMRSFATDQNPRIELLQTEMSTLRDQIHKLEASGGSEGIQVPASRLPAAGLEYVRKLRDVKYHETLLELLARQYEGAYIDEAKSAPLIQVVDRAVVPDKKAWPPRALLVAATALVFLFLMSAVVLAQHYLRHSRELVE
jgi:uncharacterized protein involved in exopolysaccharide biosynthesis